MLAIVPPSAEAISQIRNILIYEDPVRKAPSFLGLGDLELCAGGECISLAKVYKAYETLSSNPNASINYNAIEISDNNPLIKPSGEWLDFLSMINQVKEKVTNFPSGNRIEGLLSTLKSLKIANLYNNISIEIEASNDGQEWISGAIYVYRRGRNKLDARHAPIVYGHIILDGFTYIRGVGKAYGNPTSISGFTNNILIFALPPNSKMYLSLFPFVF